MRTDTLQNLEMWLDGRISFPDVLLKNSFQNVQVIISHCTLKLESLLRSLEIVLSRYGCQSVSGGGTCTTAWWGAPGFGEALCGIL